MGSSIASDPRLDPRIKAMMGAMPAMEARDAESREQLLAEAASEEAVAAREAMAGFMDMVDNEEIAPSAGLNIRNVIGVCPVINPANAMRAMDESGWIYQHYFERKWSRSIRKKKALFPELYGDDDMDLIKGLNARTEYMARKYNGYESVQCDE